MDYPPEDREMDLREHIAELRTRLIRIVIATVITMSAIFTFSGKIFSVFWHDLFGDLPFYVLSPVEWVVAMLSFSLIASLVLLYPYIIYELYSFAKPGLYEHERRFLKTIIIPSYIIFVVGLAAAYKFVIPTLYSIAITASADPYLSAGKTVSNAIKLMLSFGFFLQIPLVTLLANRYGVLDYQTFKMLRIPVYVLVFLLITNITADFTGLTQVASLALFVAMYELSLLLMRFAKNI